MTKPESLPCYPESLGREHLPLMAHVASGIALLKSGQGIKAYEHFAYFQKPENGDIDVDIGLGRCEAIEQLIDEADLVRAASTVAKNSGISESGRSAEIGGWFVGQSGAADFGIDKELYKPRLVERFHQEVAIVAAEEWLHMVQKIAKISLAGQADTEVDIAAYLDRAGVNLSADFLTRYAGRAVWCASRYPERRSELVAFSRTYSRNVADVLSDLSFR